jgi:hypothetical protein
MQAQQEAFDEPIDIENCAVEDIKGFSQQVYEKFAELIVTECVKLCEHKSNDDEYDQYDMGQSVKAENIKTAIKQHFGVEE